MVAHEKADMARMQDPTEGFCEGIRGVDDARDVGESDFTKGTPLLEAKIADSNVARTGGGAIVVDDLDGGIVVFPNRRRVRSVSTSSRLLSSKSNGSLSSRCDGSTTSPCTLEWIGDCWSASLGAALPRLARRLRLTPGVGLGD